MLLVVTEMRSKQFLGTVSHRVTTTSEQVVLSMRRVKR